MLGSALSVSVNIGPRSPGGTNVFVYKWRNDPENPNLVQFVPSDNPNEILAVRRDQEVQLLDILRTRPFISHTLPVYPIDLLPFDDIVAKIRGAQRSFIVRQLLSDDENIEKVRITFIDRQSGRPFTRHVKWDSAVWVGINTPEFKRAKPDFTKVYIDTDTGMLIRFHERLHNAGRYPANMPSLDDLDNLPDAPKENVFVCKPPKSMTPYLDRLQIYGPIETFTTTSEITTDSKSSSRADS